MLTELQVLLALEAGHNFSKYCIMYREGLTELYVFLALEAGHHFSIYCYNVQRSAYRATGVASTGGWAPFQ